MKDTPNWNKELLQTGTKIVANWNKELLQTGTKKLAEANARDNYFAIGMPLTHPEVLDSTKWSENGNQLGEILMELRVELRT